MRENLTMTFSVAAVLAALFGCTTGPADFETVPNDQKNVLTVEWRTLPADWENLAARESGKWNFNFRPYGKEGSDMLWSDPNAIRSVMEGEKDGTSKPTALYVSADERELAVLVFAGLPESGVTNALSKGEGVPEFRGECFFLPGDADNPPILNWQPFGPTSRPGKDYELSWMKWDRDNRDLLGVMTLDARRVRTGIVMKIAIPWVALYDHLPFLQGKRDSFWRLGFIRWDTAVTWGGVVHQQLAAGYLRFDLDPSAERALMKNTLLACWKRYLEVRDRVDVRPGTVIGRDDPYRARTLEANPHTYVNPNEDWGFRDAWLLPAIAERNAFGKGIADFETMTPAEQEAFYAKATRLLYNFEIDLDEAKGKYQKALAMKPDAPARGRGGLAASEKNPKSAAPAATNLTVVGDAKWDYLDKKANELETTGRGSMDEVDAIRAERDRVTGLSEAKRFEIALSKLDSGDTNAGYARALEQAFAAAGTNAAWRLRVYDTAVGCGYRTRRDGVMYAEPRRIFMRDVALKDPLVQKERLGDYLPLYAKAAYADYEATEKFILGFDKTNRAAVRKALKELWTVAGRRYLHGLDEPFARKLLALEREELAEFEATRPPKPNAAYFRQVDALRRRVVTAAMKARDWAVAEAVLAALETVEKPDRTYIAFTRGKIAFETKRYADVVKLLKPLADDPALDKRNDFPAEELVRSFMALGDVKSAAFYMEKKFDCFSRHLQRNYYKPRLDALKKRAAEL